MKQPNPIFDNKYVAPIFDNRISWIASNQLESLDKMHFELQASPTRYFFGFWTLVEASDMILRPDFLV